MLLASLSVNQSSTSDVKRYCLKGLDIIYIFLVIWFLLYLSSALMTQSIDTDAMKMCTLGNLYLDKQTRS